MVRENFCRLQKFYTLVLQPRKTPLLAAIYAAAVLAANVFAASAFAACAFAAGVFAAGVFVVKILAAKIPAAQTPASKTLATKTKYDDIKIVSSFWTVIGIKTSRFVKNDQIY